MGWGGGPLELGLPSRWLLNDKDKIMHKRILYMDMLDDEFGLLLNVEYYKLCMMRGSRFFLLE